MKETADLDGKQDYLIYLGYVIIGIVVAFIAFVVLPAFLPGRRPLPTESDYAHRVPGYWEWYYSTKYLNRIHKPPRGSGLEVHFRENRAPAESEELIDARTLSLRAVGDLMMRRDLVPPASPHLWDEVGEYLFDGDLVVGNLEFSVNEKWNIEKLLRYSVPPHYAAPLLRHERFGGFDLVSTANNHINDSLREGIVSTCDYLDSIGVRHVGANRTPEDRDRFPILDVAGVRIAFLAYTFSTNTIALEQGHEYGANLVRFNALRDRDYDPSMILQHIKQARDQGADLIVSIHHWGVEFEYYPPARLVSRAHDLLEAGVDVIIGHHPHILNPAEWYRTRDGRRTLCFYSIGNLTAWALPHPIQRMAEIINIDIETGRTHGNTRVVRPKGVTITPTFFLLDHPRTPRANHRIVHLFACADRIRRGTPPSYLTSSDARTIMRLEREFRRHLAQDAFAYR